MRTLYWIGHANQQLSVIVYMCWGIVSLYVFADWVSKAFTWSLTVWNVWSDLWAPTYMHVYMPLAKP